MFLIVLHGTAASLSVISGVCLGRLLCGSALYISYAFYRSLEAVKSGDHLVYSLKAPVLTTKQTQTDTLTAAITTLLCNSDREINTRPCAVCLRDSRLYWQGSGFGSGCLDDAVNRLTGRSLYANKGIHKFA